MSEPEIERETSSSLAVLGVPCPPWVDGVVSSAGSVGFSCVSLWPCSFSGGRVSLSWEFSELRFSSIDDMAKKFVSDGARC